MSRTTERSRPRLIAYIVGVSVQFVIFSSMCILIRPHGDGLSGDYIRRHIVVLTLSYYLVAAVMYIIIRRFREARHKRESGL